MGIESRTQITRAWALAIGCCERLRMVKRKKQKIQLDGMNVVNMMNYMLLPQIKYFVEAEVWFRLI